MAFASRDPYYLAVVSEQTLGVEDGSATEALCIRCHAPAGSEEAAGAETPLSLDDLLFGDSAAANLGRDGVTCTLCHQIRDSGLGELESFTGGFSVGYERQIFGPHASPNVDPMQFFVEYTPTQADHVASSELCATCHTVIIPVVEGGQHVSDFVEQAPYLEQQASDLATTPCRACHLPATDASGAPLHMPIASYPETLSARSPFGAHTFEGANAYMLTVLSRNIAWTGSSVPASELELAAARSIAHLETAAELTVEAGAGSEVLVTVKNKTAHKLPTGYPGRRLWLHLVATDASGATVLESGGWDDEGRLVDSSGTSLEPSDDMLPHLDRIEAGDQVALWESVPAGSDGRPTYVPLDAVYYAKDNRITPEGFTSDGAYGTWIRSVGVSGDDSFAAGRDQVRFVVPPATAHVSVELVYQSIAPGRLSAMAALPTPAAVRFSQMAASVPATPVIIATAALSR